MIESLIVFLHNTVLPWGPGGVFVAALLEEIIAPIPSALVMLGSGFLFVEGPLSMSTLGVLVTHVAIPIALGVAIGSIVVYAIARYAGIPVLKRWGHVLGISDHDIDKAHTYFSESTSDDWLVFIARVIPVVPAVVIALGAGLIRMPFWRYMVLSVIGTLLRASILGAIGWQVGEVYIEYADIFARWERVVLIGMIVLGAGLGLYMFMRARRRTDLSL